MTNTETTSINKFISSTGVCSRRQADEWIEAGRVAINGLTAIKGNRVAAGDTVTLDGGSLQAKPAPVYLLLHKPPGITCTTDTNEKDNIIDFLRYPQRIFPVGRLDKASSGLLLLTNDGDLVNQVLRAENKHEKEYVVSVDRTVTTAFLQRMGEGLPILGKMTNPCEIEKMGKSLFRIVLTQGMNRQIRRMCEYLGYRVITLKRVRIMHLELGKLALGKYRALKEAELQELQLRLDQAPGPAGPAVD